MIRAIRKLENKLAIHRPTWLKSTPSSKDQAAKSLAVFAFLGHLEPEFGQDAPFTHLPFDQDAFLKAGFGQKMPLLDLHVETDLAQMPLGPIKPGFGQDALDPS